MKFLKIAFVFSLSVMWSACGESGKDAGQEEVSLEEEANKILANNVKKARTTAPTKPTKILLHGKLAGGNQVGFGLVSSDPVKINIKQLELSESGVSYELVTTTEASYDGSFAVEVEYSTSLLVEGVLESDGGDTLSAVVPPVGSETKTEDVEVVLDDVSNLAAQMFLRAASDKTGIELIKNKQFDYFGMYEIAMMTQQNLENSIKDYGNIDINDIDAVLQAILELTGNFITENKLMVEEILKSLGKDGASAIPSDYFEQRSKKLFLGEGVQEQSWEDKIKLVEKEIPGLKEDANPEELEKKIDETLSENGLDKAVAVWTPEEKKAIIELKKKKSDIETKKKILASILSNDELKDKLLNCDEALPECAALKELMSKLPQSKENVAEKKEKIRESLPTPAEPEEEFTSALKPKEEAKKIPENKILTEESKSEDAIEEAEPVKEEKPEISFEEEEEKSQEESIEEDSSLALIPAETEKEEQKASEENSEDSEDKLSEIELKTQEPSPEPEIAKNGCYISQDVCSRFPKKVGVFTDSHQNSDKNSDRCMRRAVDFHRWCQNDVSDTTTAEFYDNGTLVDKTTVNSACLIEQNVCNKRPTRVGIFLDYHRDSYKDEARCLRRANDFARWCGNSYQDATIARFYDNGALVAEKSTKASACEIELNYCSKRPERAGKFLDFHRGSDSSQDVCMKRAHEFARWCGNSYEYPVVARFFQQGELVAAESTRDSACEVELSACTKHPERVGTFLDFHRGAHKDQEVCLKRADQYHKWCGNAYMQEVKVRFMQNGEATAGISTKTSGCEISQDVCRMRPGRAGVFMDYHQNANKSEERCMRRAIDYHKWCGNLVSELTTATFYEGDEVKAQTDTSSGCMIEQDVCLKHPEKVGTFLDNHRGADKDETKCLARAKEFHRWCGNGYPEITIAKFVVDGEVKATKSTYESACVIEQEICRKRPNKAGSFTDYHQNSDTDQSRCLKRADEYHRWCGNTYDDVTTALFYESGEVKAKKDTRTACVIEQNTCRLHPHKVGNLIDWSRKTSTDPELCLKRAGQIHRWCGNSFENVTIATFYEDGVAKASKDTTSGCLIQQDQCAARPHRAGEFLDFHRGADTDAQKCLKRAKEYHRWCKNPYDTVTTAKFFKDGELIGEKDTSTSCVISQNTCQKHSHWTGEFTDYHRSADTDEASCLKRSFEYHRWCGNSFADTTKASFYKDGNLVASKETTSGCFIELTQCDRYPKRAGSFFDTYQNSEVDQDRCLRRADDYHKWCKNPAGLKTSTATFYQNGKIEASREAAGN